MERMLFIETPVGKLGITASDEAVTRIFFGREYRNRRRPRNAPEACTPETAGPLLLQAAAELAEYFAGTRREFTLPLAPAGTPFQQAVWEALRTIPYGETRTYGQIAAQIGRPTACRAVGMANNRNPIAIVVPCHRVVGSTGALVGYAGGLGVKTHLLNLEKPTKTDGATAPDNGRRPASRSTQDGLGRTTETAAGPPALRWQKLIRTKRGRHPQKM